MTDELRKWIRTVPDFPRKGILFYDITTALLRPDAFKSICDTLHERYRKIGLDKVAGIESRGFIFAAVLADRLGKGLVTMRKPGKLPWKTISERYELEYGEAELEMHVDAVSRGDRVLIVDDLLATGGTAAAAARLVERQGGIVAELAFVIELSELGGAEKLEDRSYFTLLSV